MDRWADGQTDEQINEQKNDIITIGQDGGRYYEVMYATER